MKIPLIYGAGIATAITAVSLTLFALGYHSNLTHFDKIAGSASIGVFALAVTGIGLAIRAQRAATPTDQTFPFSKAFKTGITTALYTGLFTGILSFIYVHFINPPLLEIIYQSHVQSAKAMGLTGEQLAKFEIDERKMSVPAARGLISFFQCVVSGAFISLFAGFIMRRKPSAKS